jgi:hypothetical protein
MQHNLLVVANQQQNQPVTLGGIAIQLQALNMNVNTRLDSLETNVKARLDSLLPSCPTMLVQRHSS